MPLRRHRGASHSSNVCTPRSDPGRASSVPSRIARPYAPGSGTSTTRPAPTGRRRPAAHHVRHPLDPGPGQVGHPAGGRRHGERDEPLGHLARRDRLRLHRRHDHDGAELHPRVELRGELVELRRAQDRPRHRPRLDELLLQHLPGVVGVRRVVDCPRSRGRRGARTPAAASAASRLRVTAPKNARDAASDIVCVEDTSITTSTPASASARPTPVTRSTPVDRVSTTGSWPVSRTTSTTWRPTVPVPPATAIFMRVAPVRVRWRVRTAWRGVAAG